MLLGEKMEEGEGGGGGGKGAEEEEGEEEKEEESTASSPSSQGRLLGPSTESCQPSNIPSHQLI